MRLVTGGLMKGGDMWHALRHHPALMRCAGGRGRVCVCYLHDGAVHRRGKGVPGSGAAAGRPRTNHTLPQNGVGAPFASRERGAFRALIASSAGAGGTSALRCCCLPLRGVRVQVAGAGSQGGAGHCHGAQPPALPDAPAHAPGACRPLARETRSTPSNSTPTRSHQPPGLRRGGLIESTKLQTRQQ